MNTVLQRVAAGQILVEGGRASDNLQRAAESIQRAAEQGCQIIVLPECLDLGWTHPSGRTLAEAIPGKRSEFLCRAAQEHHITVVAGLTERDGLSIFNTAVLIDATGRLRLKYRKINVLDIAQSLYQIGDRMGVAHLPWGRVGVNICSDNFPNSLDLGASLGRMGAQLLLSPCAWAVEANHDQRAEPYGQLWRDAYGQLARRFRMPIVGASNVGPVEAGPWSGRRCIGCSLIVDHRGTPIAEGPYGEQALITADLECSPHPLKGTTISGSL